MIQVRKPKVWLALLGAIVLLLGVKVGRPLFTPAGPPIVLNNQPALLFFNNDEGCECVLPLYARADSVIAAWTPEQRNQVPVQRILLYQRPDLQRRYKVERAPMLVLLDAKGQIVWREWGVASSPTVFNLERVEEKIRLLTAP